MTRNYSFLDKFCLNVDQMLRTLSHTMPTTGKPSPAKGVEDGDLTAQERKHAAALMRVNHAGEVCAQALYLGQGLVSKNQSIQQKMQHAALEEGDHLAWCQQRIEELGSHTSYLNPLWYAGSFCIGGAAAMAGDPISLGFVAETERQVIQHLASHLKALPKNDERSREVLRQMELDEAKHREEALQSGARELPSWVQFLMRLTSKVMVKTAYYL